MEDLGSLWNYQEDYEYDELKLKLQYTTIELESIKLEANEQIKKHRDEANHLVNLLKLACQERDEARDQLQKLANPILPNHLTFVAKANSSVTESNTLSDTYNHHSHGSSPVDNLFDPVTSPEFSSMNMADHSSFATSMIDDLAKGKALPEKGKLLQAVMETGPLLETLFVAGPLPRWRNPPPLHTYRIPHVSIRASSVADTDSTRGTRRSCSAAMLDYAASGSASGMINGVNSQVTAVKRQRFQ